MTKQPLPENITETKAAEIARAIIIEKKFDTSVLPDRYKPLVYDEMIKVTPAFALAYIPDQEKPQELCMKAFEKDAFALKYFPKAFITEELCDDAVKRQGRCLSFMPEELKTKERCLAALDEAGYEVLDDVPEAYKTDEGFMLDAIEKDQYAPLGLDKSIWEKPKSFWIKAVSKNPLSIVIVPKQYRDIHMHTMAVAADPEALAYIPLKEWTKVMCETALKGGLSEKWDFEHWDEKKGVPYGYSWWGKLENPVYKKAQHIVQGLEIAPKDLELQKRKEAMSCDRTRSI